MHGRINPPSHCRRLISEIIFINEALNSFHVYLFFVFCFFLATTVYYLAASHKSILQRVNSTFKILILTGGWRSIRPENPYTKKQAAGDRFQLHPNFVFSWGVSITTHMFSFSFLFLFWQFEEIAVQANCSSRAHSGPAFSDPRH
jgi:hypothetical protein